MEDRRERRATCQVDDHRHQERQAGDEEDLPRQGVELTSERGLRLLRRLQHPGDVADLGGHPRRDDDEDSGPSGDVGVHVDHVAPVPERGVLLLDRGRALRDGQALAGEGGLGDLEGRGAQQPPVGRDDVAGLDCDDVSGDQLLGRQLGKLAVARDPGLDDHHLLQGGDRGGGLAFLSEAEHRVEHGQQQQEDAGAHLLERVEAPDPGHEEHDLHRVGVLAQEGVDAGLGRRRR